MNEEAKETFFLTENNKKWIEDNMRENNEKTAILKFLKRKQKKEQNFYKNFPDKSKMEYYRFVSPASITTYNFSCYNYENVFIFDANGGPSIFYLEKFNEKNIADILYIISYFRMIPCLSFFENKEFTSKVFELASIETIDFTDMLQIRYFKKNGLKKKITINPKDVFFKLNSKNYVVFQKLLAPDLLGLYHASLFQKDIAAKCVFLFRIIDCINSKYNSKNLSIPSIINYYYDKAIKYRFQPIYVKRFYINYKNNSIDFKDKEDKNYFQLLKEEAKQIRTELLSKYPYLSFGEIIYNVGRGSVAHARAKNFETISLHNFEKDLLEINDINIIYELIVRFAIEDLNPQLKNKIEKRKIQY